MKNFKKFCKFDDFLLAKFDNIFLILCLLM